MSRLHRALASYLKLRRSLGYKLRRSEKLLNQFLNFLNAAGAETITTQRALAWSCQPNRPDGYWWNQRLSVVRGFAKYVQTIDPSTEIPSRELLPWRPCRASPYLYTEQEISALINAAGTLSTPLRVATYQTLIGMLAVTGMRVGEAINLDSSDFDARHGVLTIRGAKFNKQRELPLHATTISALRQYLGYRNRQWRGRKTEALFISTAGTRLLYCNIQWTFRRLAHQAGLVPRTRSCRPRIHDLRHAFAVRTLLEAYRDRADTQRQLTLLSTYLGHVNPAQTYWYLSAAPELLSAAAMRLERPYGGGS